MTDVIRDQEVAFEGRPPRLVGEVSGGLSAALMEQQATLMQAGVGDKFGEETDLASFLRRNPMLDPEHGRMPLQPTIHFTGRLFEATVGVLGQLDRQQLGLHTYGFDDTEREQVVELVHDALLNTSPHIHRNTGELLAAMRAADAKNFETSLNNVRIALVRRYAELVDQLDIPSLMLQRRYVEITEALNGEPMTAEARLATLSNFTATASSLYPVRKNT